MVCTPRVRDLHLARPRDMTLINKRGICCQAELTVTKFTPGRGRGPTVNDLIITNRRQGVPEYDQNWIKTQLFIPPPPRDASWSWEKSGFPFFKVKKAILGRKNFFRSYSIIKNLKKSGNPGIPGKLAWIPLPLPISPSPCLPPFVFLFGHLFINYSNSQPAIRGYRVNIVQNVVTSDIYQDMFYRYQRLALGRITIFYCNGKCLKLKNKMAAKFTMKCAIIPYNSKPLSSNTLEYP